MVLFRQFGSNSCLSYSLSEAETEDQLKDPQPSRRSGLSSTNLSPCPSSMTGKLHLDPCQRQRRPPQGIAAMGLHPCTPSSRATKPPRMLNDNSGNDGNGSKYSCVIANPSVHHSLHLPFPPFAIPSARHPPCSPLLPTLRRTTLSTLKKGVVPPVTDLALLQQLPRPPSL